VGELQKRDELVDDAIHQLRELGQKWQDRLTLDNLRLDERYLIGDLSVGVEFRPLGWADGDNLIAFLNYWPSRAGGPLGRGGGEVDPHSYRTLLPGRKEKARGDVTNLHGGDDQHSVFVEVVQLVKAPEAVVPSLIRLCGLDELKRTRGDALYYSGVEGFIFLGSLANRVRGSLRRSASAGFNQLPCEVVQSGAQAVGGLTNDDGDTGRKACAYVNPKSLLTGLRVFLGPASIGAGIAKDSQVMFQISDVLFGPVDFRPDAV
jgi:hypothetical protein